MMLCTTHRIGRLIGYSPSLQARQTITHVEVCPDTAVRRDVSGPLIVATVAAVVECIWRVPLVEPGDVVSDHVHVLHDDALAGCVQRPVVCPTSHGLWAFPLHSKARTPSLRESGRDCGTIGSSFGLNHRLVNSNVVTPCGNVTVLGLQRRPARSHNRRSDAAHAINVLCSMFRYCNANITKTLTTVSFILDQERIKFTLYWERTTAL